MKKEWAWALLAIAVVGATIALFMMDAPDEPGAALTYDASPHLRMDEDAVCYREAARIPLELDAPQGLAVDGAGKIYVVGEGSLLVLDGSGGLLDRHVVEGSPQCIAVAPDGAVYLGATDHVTALSLEDGTANAWPLLGEGAWLTSLAADDDYVYAADAGNKCVWRYDRAGAVVNAIAGNAEGGGFIVPSHYFDIALDVMGALWVVNPGKLGLEKYRGDGGLISLWHQPGMALDQFPGCCNPTHIAFMSNGSLATSEKGVNRIKVYAADLTFTCAAASPDSLNAGWTAVGDRQATPAIRDLAVDGDDRILALHGPLRSLLVYEATPEDKEVS